MGALPAFGYHIHGTIFDVIPSGIWENAPLKVQTWEVSPGNAAIFEASWKEAGRYPFHIHGVPEEKGTMAYFEVSDAPANAVDGKDISKTKSIYMWNWQKDLLTKLQARDAKATVTQSTSTSSEAESHVAHMLGISTEKSSIIETTTCEIEKGAAMQSTNKSFYPQHIQAKAGDTVQWTNNDTSIHTVTGEIFDSGMLMAGDQFEYTFESPGVYDYYCVLHPWMKGSCFSDSFLSFSNTWLSTLNDIVSDFFIRHIYDTYIKNLFTFFIHAWQNIHMCGLSLELI